jgi:hypothetical protein
MEDWNNVIGDKSYRNIVGPQGLGRRNQRSKMLIDFCERNGLVITNACFKSLREDCTPGKYQEIEIDIRASGTFWIGTSEGHGPFRALWRTENSLSVSRIQPR